MWKESYKIGVEMVDKQHYELFCMVDKLLRLVKSDEEWETQKAACREAIAFLKDYVVFHFKAEEEYQQSINYVRIKEHKLAHEKFTSTVLNYEKRFIKTDFDRTVILDFVGTLTAWLIYHVADEDQKFAGNKSLTSESSATSIDESYIFAVIETLSNMAGIEKNEFKTAKAAPNANADVAVTVGLIGETPYQAVFAFSKELAFELIKAMTFMEVSEIDELVCSALAEICNITSGTVASEIAQKGFACDITTPTVSVQPFSPNYADATAVSTPIGSLYIGVSAN